MSLRELIVGVDCWALRLDGGGARFVFESLLEKFKGAPYRFLLFLHPEAYQCVQQVEDRIGLLRNVAKLRINSPEQMHEYSDLFDIFYCPFNSISARCFEKPVVAVLHDIQEKFFPEFFSPADRHARAEVYSDILRSADHVITISEFCKTSFIDFYGGNANRISVVYNAPQEALLRHARDADTGQPPPAEPFIIYPANFYVHKNHRRLLQAYALGRSRDCKLPALVLVGKSWGGSSDPSADIESMGLSDAVRIVGNLRPAELAALYSRCAFVVLPTLFEGFCLPAVEALAFGKSLVCSDLPILREVTAGHARFFDPMDPTSIWDAIEAQSKHPKASDAETLRAVAARYDWNDSAAQTLSIIDETFHRYHRPTAPTEPRAVCAVLVMVGDEPAQWLTDTLTSISIAAPSNFDVKVTVISLTGARFDGTASFESIELTLIDASQQSPQGVWADVSSAAAVWVIFAGSVVTRNSFLNIGREQNTSSQTKILIGEVRQVHEDLKRTHEANNYIRLVDGHKILKGHLFAEMLVLFSPGRWMDMPKKWEHYFDQWSAVETHMHQNTATICRRTLATVHYRSSQYNQRTRHVIPAIRYQPAAVPTESTSRHSHRSEVIRYVESAIAQRVGQLDPPAVGSTERRFEALQ